jgi:hypothetical protein
MAVTVYECRNFEQLVKQAEIVQRTPNSLAILHGDFTIADALLWEPDTRKIKRSSEKAYKNAPAMFGYYKAPLFVDISEISAPDVRQLPQRYTDLAYTLLKISCSDAEFDELRIDTYEFVCRPGVEITHSDGAVNRLH